MAETEIIARRRKWTPDEKAALLAEVEAEGGRVAKVARRHGLSESLLYNWRSVSKASVPTSGVETIEFRPIGMIGRMKDAPPALLVSPERSSPADEHREERVSKIEIELPNGIRVRVGASVSEKALSRVLRALKGAA
jgi:transposase